MIDTRHPTNLRIPRGVSYSFQINPELIKPMKSSLKSMDSMGYVRNMYSAKPQVQRTATFVPLVLIYTIHAIEITKITHETRRVHWLDARLYAGFDGALPHDFHFCLIHGQPKQDRWKLNVYVYHTCPSLDSSAKDKTWGKPRLHLLMFVRNTIRAQAQRCGRFSPRWWKTSSEGKSSPFLASSPGFSDHELSTCHQPTDSQVNKKSMSRWPHSKPGMMILSAEHWSSRSLYPPNQTVTTRQIKTLIRTCQNMHAP